MAGVQASKVSCMEPEQQIGWGHPELAPHADYLNMRRTNVQQLTCKIDLSNSFYYLFFSFIVLELKPFVLKGKVLGEKF